MPVSRNGPTYGLFINDVTQEWGGVMLFCDNTYEDVSKTPMLV